MKHYLMVDIDEDSICCGDRFLVGADSEEEAYAIAHEVFEDDVFYCLGTLTEWEAEASGLDEF